VAGDPRLGTIAAITRVIATTGESIIRRDPGPVQGGHVVVNVPELPEEMENTVVALRAAMALFAFSSCR
jgi:hypothetical protein